MEQLNYCRQFLKQAIPFLKVPSIDANLRALVSGAVDLAQVSTKFLMPEGGRLFDDIEFRGLDETQTLHLPYPFIALEYYQPPSRPIGEQVGTLNGRPIFEPEETVSAPKRIVFARERDDWIVLTIAFCTKHDGHWRVLPECAIPRTGYLDRSVQSESGRTMFRAAFQQMDKDGASYADYADEMGAMLCFLNVLQCRNVHIEKKEPGKVRKAMNSGKKGALPFDTYHVLTIDAPGRAQERASDGGSHRSPREHLRRGHIRRLGDGRRIWVNATVVAAGGGGGAVSKDYLLAA